jgi:uncharacterized protein YjiS (DUF1127 family)
MSTAPATTGEKFHAFLEAAVDRVVGVVRAMQNRRSVAKLLEWDDRMLRDIGLTQSDVRAVMAIKPTEDPSLRLDALSCERRAAQRAEARERLELFGGSATARPRKRSLPPSRSYPVLDL